MLKQVLETPIELFSTCERSSSRSTSILRTTGRETEQFIKYKYL